MDTGTTIVAELVKLGVLGIGLVALGWWIVFTHKEHKKEREKWNEVNQQQFKQVIDSSNANTSALTKMNTLLETLIDPDKPDKIHRTK